MNSLSFIQTGTVNFEIFGNNFTTVMGTVFTLLYLYQFVYIFIALIRRPKQYPTTDQSNHYAVIIAARNEENVLPELLKSVAGQTYPAEKVTVFVVADNCTDTTAATARALGAVVYERQNKERVGKGYALEFLFDHIEADYGITHFKAYIVLDADNVLRPNYIEEMDKVHSAGYRVVTSYRNSKNYGANWVSAGYALWFMRESRHLNHPRTIIGTNAAISGTGFLVDSGIIKRNGGWKHFLLTEDIEFTADCAVQGERIGYCHNAELFDEQPETFRQSWRQRKRWAKGYFQVFHKYGGKLLKGCAKMRWACYDVAMNIMPAFIMTFIQLLMIASMLIANLLINHNISIGLLRCFMRSLAYGYGLFFVLGLFTLITEWKRIHCNKAKAVLYFFTFPIFMLSYVPISLVALFTRVEWKPIEHKRVVNVEEIEAKNKENFFAGEATDSDKKE